MIGSIERLSRQLRATHVAPMMLLVIGVTGASTDPISKRAAGTAGVIAIPAVPPPNPAGHDGASSERRDARNDRGRVLYAPGRAPRDTVAAPAARTTPKSTCVDQHAVKGRARNSAPTS
jgi:hypothetical protein